MKAFYKVGKWMPSDEAILQRWLAKVIAEEATAREPLLPAVEDLALFIAHHPHIERLCIDMFTELPPAYQEKMEREWQVTDYHHMLRLINHIIQRAPQYDDEGLVGCPMNALLNWPMGTQSGHIFFSNPQVNQYLKAILDTWGTYLQSPDSAQVLTEDSRGWLQPKALTAMANAAYGTSFPEVFVCRSSSVSEHLGFTSWDDFFTREIRPEVRPVAESTNPLVITNACESTPYRIAHKVQFDDTFWIKAQPYSLLTMFHRGSWAQRFVGGTVYQAYLSALSYHRWHSPVTGTVVAAYKVPGTYFAENEWEGFTNPSGPDSMAPDRSQAYLAEVATRAIIIIKADEPKIGYVGFIAIGMAEVSTCDIRVQVGDHLQKGDLMGMFHFGGSTHCLVFSPNVSLTFTTGEELNVVPKNLKVKDCLARVT